ncbi:MAG: ribosome silencing factor [Helicobacter sp.]|uniref:ribosome silencing factor n=1 Tax=Helicobacter sp. 10-6591 TaxID=2004998 RepID=UPI000DCC7905|nr:ribosome silencing factor [Helicobacter sp. 10-6591]MCI6217859.1 ribosome silencing factor [Helicobacter sp.]MCI7485303.1 ribosome silencing factor [Helicobacter sp.]MDD7567595.1 ribosome silencing factor [Helicobacter sp.]MDY5740922.1 ribosome silencing factor [Helicobacter sp.]RAX55716.1 ribosome silencing factor [Helicobacter sp. 10-6591]
MGLETTQLIETIKFLLEEKKAENIVVTDVREKEYLVDFVIIATAMAGKHSFALLDFLKSTLKMQDVEFYATDEDSEDWVIADLGEVMVHIFTENHRNKFNLEEFLTTLPQRM